MNEITYHYLLMSQKEFLENQCVEEILREKSHYYSVRQKYRDFWVTISPKFIFDPTIFSRIKETQFYEQKKKNFRGEEFKDRNFFASLISQDKDFINWIGLRLGYFENIEKKNFVEEAKTKNFVSDGIRGTIKVSTMAKGGNINPLSGSINSFDPEIIEKKQVDFWGLYYKRLDRKEFFK
jgi:Protein of unknown function (DUF2488)